MLVRNEATGQNCALTNHARERFAQIDGHSTDDIVTSLARAVPFGAQRGRGYMLLDGDVTFIGRMEEDRDRLVITTVLTRAMAVCNIQANGIDARRPAAAEAMLAANLPKQNPASPLPVPGGSGMVYNRATQSAAAERSKINEQAQGIHKLDDAALVAIFVDTQGMLQSGTVMGKRRTAYGKLLQVIELERSKRKAAGKFERMAEDERRNNIVIKTAMKELLTQEQRMAIFTRATELRKQYEADQWQPLES